MFVLQDKLIEKIEGMQLALLADQKIYIRYEDDIDKQPLTNSFLSLGCSDVKLLSKKNFLDAYQSIEPRSYLLYIDVVDGGLVCTLINRQVHHNPPFLLELLNRAYSFKLNHGRSDA